MDLTSLRPVPFEERYEASRQLWLDGPHGGWLAIDGVLRREGILNTPYWPDDNLRFASVAQLRARPPHVVRESNDIATENVRLLVGTPYNAHARYGPVVMRM